MNVTTKMTTSTNISWCFRRYLFTSPRLSDKSFLDSLQLRVQGGKGGRGNPNYGGRGGDGGSVIFKGARTRKLQHLQRAHAGKIIKADDGKNSERARILGSPGADVVIQVPTGLTLCTRKGHLLGEINAHGDVVCVAKGGRGGGPDNDYQAKGPKPSFVNLDLKLVADVGLVGFPNAGKSTLLTRLSNATPKIASYPFTTLQPQLGMLISEADDRKSQLLGLPPRRITIADLPGLVEGASKNVGLGYEFLKHIERTKVLLMVVDVHGFFFGTTAAPFARDPFQTVCLLLRELATYDAALSRRPTLLCVNKVENDAGLNAVRDLVARLNDFDAAVAAAFPGDDEESLGLRAMAKPSFHDVHAISAKDNINLQPLAENLFSLLLRDRRTAEREEEGNVDQDGTATDLAMRSRGN